MNKQLFKTIGTIVAAIVLAGFSLFTVWTVYRDHIIVNNMAMFLTQQIQAAQKSQVAPTVSPVK